MAPTSDLVLRPRFKMELHQNKTVFLQAFEAAKDSQSEFIITRLDDHVFIKFPKHKQHFWSPQLHLEINAIDDHSCLLHGFFGPNPTVWTLFMFLHFMVAGFFIAFGIWGYTNWALNTSYAIQVSLMFLMIIIWFTLYFAGRIGKGSSKQDMHQLNDLMKRILKTKKP